MTALATETQYEDTIIAAARMLGYRVHAERPARSARGWRTPVKGDPGWPDLVIAGHGRMWIIELKRKPNRVTADQCDWIEELCAAGVEASVVWLPEGMPGLLDRLAVHAATARKVRAV